MSGTADYRRIIELENTVQQLNKDKEALLNDLESRLLTKSNSSWFNSNVLADRISHAELERTQLKEELSRVKAERDSYREDGLQIKAAKKTADQISKSVMEKNRVFERELSFYKKHCADALEERNLYSYEVEELKTSNQELGLSLNDINNQLGIALEEKARMAANGKEAHKQIRQLKERVVDCGKIPVLESQLQFVTQQKCDVQIEHDRLQDLLKVYQSEIEGAMSEIGQLKAEKQFREADLEEVRKRSAAAIETEKRKSADLTLKLLEATREVDRRKLELQNAESLAAASQKETEILKESHLQKARDAHLESRHTIEQLERRLEEADGLLVSKTTEFRSAIEAKVAALESASDWEAKWLTLYDRLSDIKMHRNITDDSNGSTAPNLRRLSPGIGRGHINKSEKQNWFRFRSRPSIDAFKNIEPSSESLSHSLDLVLELVPQLRSIYEGLEFADPVRTGSKRKSISRLDIVRVKITDLQKDLEAHPMSPHMDDSAGRYSAHVTVGMEAVHLAFYCVARLEQFIKVAS